MENVVLLARDIREANAYRRDKNIRATFAETIEQVAMATKIIELPGFDRRRDKFALLQAAKNRINFARPKGSVDWVLEADWEPAPVVREQAAEETIALEAIAKDEPEFGDLSDPANLEILKAKLNEVGWTLKKLPSKTKDAPVVTPPVEF